MFRVSNFLKSILNESFGQFNLRLCQAMTVVCVLLIFVLAFARLNSKEIAINLIDLNSFGHTAELTSFKSSELETITEIKILMNGTDVTNDKHVKVFNLTSALNEFEYFPNGIGDVLPHLKMVRFKENKIKFIARENFKNMDHLLTLDLSSNMIESIPEDAFRDLVKLRYLSLSNNTLSVLPQNVLQTLRKLQYFCANLTQVEVIPEKLFNSNEVMSVADFSYAKVSSIKANFSELRAITNINFTGNVCIDAALRLEAPDHKAVRVFQNELNEKCNN